MSTARDPDSTEAQANCPRCVGRAVPKSVATHGPGKVIIQFRCETCQHEWTVERKAQTLFESTDE